ncbi:MAG: S-methyl-5-thioribose-1-phosphate isomerase [Bacteroidetes bacterium]|nr:S-methyl-5-thioribose-1-phosphate isomerase [Bacteroidota bacterium]MBK8681966.1 S-methyl-5-thioribose-1-phosphate isomerase [Bacteroidota bacterium]
MKIKDTYYTSIWLNPNDPTCVQIIDQRQLPHMFEIKNLRTVEDACKAISEMWVRGAPLIGATAAWGMYLGILESPAHCTLQFYFQELYSKLLNTRPTAVNLRWAIDKMMLVLSDVNTIDEAKAHSKLLAKSIMQDDIKTNSRIGEFGLEIILDLKTQLNRTINILTHCNAGWLATVDWGTATAPIYKAIEAGIDIHVWVDETRPRNQGASLTAWELLMQNIPHTLITDNAGGHLMQNGLVDLVIVGTDRTSNTGDVCNKIGTYLKALAAYDNHIPFYVAAPSSSIDWNMHDAFSELEIEERDTHEVKYIKGKFQNKIVEVLICPEDTPASNFSFDITPAKYITGLITERGICESSNQGLKELFPEKF